MGNNICSQTTTKRKHNKQINDNNSNIDYNKIPSNLNSMNNINNNINSNSYNNNSNNSNNINYYSNINNNNYRINNNDNTNNNEINKNNNDNNNIINNNDNNNNRNIINYSSNDSNMNITNNNRINNNINYNNSENKMKKLFFKEPKSYNLIVHKNDGMNDYIIEMTLTKLDKNIFHEQIEFIMILDVSGSMSSYVHNLVSKIIPTGLNLLNYGDNNLIHLITFQTFVKLYEMTVGQLKNDTSIIGNGTTNMADVYKFVKSVLDNNSTKKNYRILVLSDGMIWNQEETKKQAEILKNYLDGTDYSISVGSIRYNSGSDQADTRAISSVLMLNTDISKTRVLTEVNSFDSNEKVSQKIYDLFKDDYFESDFILKSEKIKFRIEPWKEGSNEVKLNEGKNIIFADKNPTIEDVGIYEQGKLKYTKKDFTNGYKMAYSNYNSILGAKIRMTARKVRINKTSGSRAALEENKKIIDYYENFEKNLSENNNCEAIIAKELKTINELDVSKFDNNQLAQFIGFEDNIMHINDYLKNVVKIDEKEENNIEEFVQDTLGNALKINLAWDKMLNS